MKRIRIVSASLLLIALSCSNEGLDPHSVKPGARLPLSEVAELFSQLPFDSQHMREVHDAVSSSIENGYDEEYLMNRLFSLPGSGIGEDETKAGGKSYSYPFRNLIQDYLQNHSATKAGDASEFDARAYLEMLASSDMQIYWPNSSDWDGYTLPIITYHPVGDESVNYGYALAGAPGSREVNTILVDEEMASKRPVWVISSNEDSYYESIELLRKRNPSSGDGGGALVTKSSAGVRTLILKDFIAHRAHDSWFGGASEYQVRIGYLDDFTASSEAELKLYNPSVTEFMVVVKRSQIDSTMNLNAVLVSSWTDQLQDVAFMVTEDDGGTVSTWNCEGTVKIKSKSYGFTVSIPVNTKDDIIWRGKLSSAFFEKYAGGPSNLGDITLTFDII